MLGAWRRDRIALALVALVLLAPVGARAQPPPGIDTAWDDCIGSGLETDDRTVACTDDATTVNRIVCSFVTPTLVARLGGSDWTMRVSVDAPNLPSWWSPSVTRYGFEVGTSSCYGIWDESPSGAFTLGPHFTQIGPSMMRLRGVVWVTAGEEPTATPGIRYHDHVLSLKFTSGTADDPGCLAAACFWFERLTLQSPDSVPDVVIDAPSTMNYVTWRHIDWTKCWITPTRKATWGSIKSLYR